MPPIRSSASRLAWVAVLSLAGTVVAADAPLKKDADAERLLRDVSEAYHALNAYADHGAFTIGVEIKGPGRKLAPAETSPLRLAFARPNKVAFDAGLARLVSDGTSMTSVVTPLKTVVSDEAPAALNVDRLFREGPVGSYVLGGPSGPAMNVLLNLAFADDPVKAFAVFSDGLTLGPDTTLDGQACKVLVVPQPGATANVLIDAKTKLVRAIDVAFDVKALAGDFPKGLDVAIPTCRWAAGAIDTGPLDDAAFALKTPETFAKVDTRVKGAALAENGPQYKVEEMIGRPAPAFNLTVLDGAGKTRTLSKADLAGKVVVIDFWATWCGPCLAELPQVRELIEGYAKTKKEVVIIALSEDDVSPDLVEVRKLVERTLKEQKLDLMGTTVGKVGLDPSGSVGELFRVEGFPTVVVLDAQGVVRSAHVGFSPEIGKTLGREIDALLPRAVPPAR